MVFLGLLILSVGCQSKQNDEDVGVSDETGALEFDTGPSADSTFLLQDMTFSPPMPMDGGVMAVVQDCSAIESNDGWTVCEAAVGQCTAIFEDGVGCFDVCAAAGLGCVEVWENLDGECEPDRSRPALSCSLHTAHQSDYCVCRGPVGMPPTVPSTTSDYEDIFEALVGFGGETTGGFNGRICRTRLRILVKGLYASA